MCKWLWFWWLRTASLSAERTQGTPALVHVHSCPSAQAEEQVALLAVYSIFDKLCTVARQISMWYVHTVVFEASKAGIQAQGARATLTAVALLDFTHGRKSYPQGFSKSFSFRSWSYFTYCHYSSSALLINFLITVLSESLFILPISVTQKLTLEDLLR